MTAHGLVIIVLWQHQMQKLAVKTSGHCLQHVLPALQLVINPFDSENTLPIPVHSGMEYGLSSSVALLCGKFVSKFKYS